jgi:hypothetical protein
MRTPFPAGPLTQHDPLCGRVQEILSLCEAAANSTPTVLYGPKLHGKTTVLDRVQSLLAQQGTATLRISLKGLRDARDLAGRILAGIKTAGGETRPPADLPAMSLTETSSLLTGRPVLEPESDPETPGTDCLKNSLRVLSDWIDSLTGPVHLVLDDMEDLALLADRDLEGELAASLTGTRTPVLFAGCRETTLLSMFKGKRRPLAELEPTLFPLPPLPESELLGYIIFQFSRSGKTCPRSVAEMIASLSGGIPHYAQSLARLVFARTDQVPEPDLVGACAFEILLRESGRYEQILAGLSPRQGALLQGVARFPGTPVFASRFLRQNSLSHSTVQRILPKLLDLDLIVRQEKTSKVYRVADPFLAEWLRGLGMPGEAR